MKAVAGQLEMETWPRSVNTILVTGTTYITPIVAVLIPQLNLKVIWDRPPTQIERDFHGRHFK